jgi:hypothetical protein
MSWYKDFVSGLESQLRRCRLRSTRPFAENAKERGTRFIGDVEFERMGQPPRFPEGTVEINQFEDVKKAAGE